MKRFKLVIEVGSEYTSKLLVHEIIEADDLVELYSKLLLINARIQESIKEDHRRYVVDDDIPF